MKILITGVAGFIGSKLAESLLKQKHKVYGVDNINNYYSVKLKKIRLKNLDKDKNFKFIKLDLKQSSALKKLNDINNIDVLFHLSAQAGVRYTISNPEKYFDDNIISFFKILEFAKNKKIKKLFYASSSSVYGDQKKFPLKENIKLFEKNIYGFSKKMNELSAETYARLFKIKLIGLRFFTVFGEWGRPDMLIFKYLKSNLEKKTFFLNAGGNHFRDFTYINDVISILLKLMNSKLDKDFYIYNICSNKPKKIKDVIKKINKFNSKFKYRSILSKELIKIEVNKTHGDNKNILKQIKGIKFTNFDKALKNTVKWYLSNEINKIT